MTKNPAAVDVCPGPDIKGRTLEPMEYWVAEQDAMKFAEILALLGVSGLTSSCTLSGNGDRSGEFSNFTGGN